MNSKACFSRLLTLTILLSLGACANRNTPTAPEILPDIISDSSQQASASKADDRDTSNTQVGTPLQSVSQEPIDIFERMRKGFMFPALKSKHIGQYEKWSAEHDSYLDSLFARGTPFLYHIVEEIEKRGLPMELALLPAVESAYRPTAVSRSKADGLWQFIPSTGRHFGLRQDWWYDGRRDALASTNAALDYLTQLNKRFDGDWFLTLAAYNAGQGTVARAIRTNKRKGKGTSYQDLALRLETRRYVPKLIALKNIINKPDAFGVELPFIESKPYFKVIGLDGQIDLTKFAADAGIDESELRHLNAGFKRWASSPEGPHRLLIPINSSGDIEHAIAASKRAAKIDFSNHKIVKGDSLSTIASQYRVSVRDLQTTNNLRGSNIRAGKNLLIPVRMPRTSEVGVMLASSSESEKQRLVHHVKRGDTLWSIARKYKVQVNNLLSWNNISKSQILKLNQSVLVMAN
ncbi:MAG: membrane-bound lytic murein transglycosylase D [Arenicella sp.]|jgi:membrane-bound lytic murein transglycosylase D